MGSNQYNEVGGVSSFASSRVVPWHGQGKVLDFDLSPRTALTAAGLDWTVRVENLSDHFNGELAGEHAFVVANTPENTVLGRCGENYVALSNGVVADFADAAMSIRDDIKVKTMYGLHHDKQIVMCLEVGDGWDLAGGQVLNYMNIYTSHDGTLPLAVRPSNLITLCMNTLAASFVGTRAEIKLRHTANVKDRIEDAKNALQVSIANYKELHQEMETLLSTPYPRERFDKEFVPAIIGPRPTKEGRATTMHDNTRNGLVEEYVAPFNTYARDSVWGAVMAVNGYEQYGTAVRNAGGDKVERWERIAEKVVRDSFPQTAKAMVLAKQLVAA